NASPSPIPNKGFHRIKEFFMKKVLGGLLLLTAIFSSSCVVTTDSVYYDSVVRNAYGTAYFEDAIDPNVMYAATCSGGVEFWGDVDHQCNAMTYSEAVFSAPLLCSYVDLDNFYHEAYVGFPFPAGYIQEYCSGSVYYPLETSASAVQADL